MSDTEIEVTPVVLELDVSTPATFELEVAPVALELEIAPVALELEVASVETVVEVSPTGPPGPAGPSGGTAKPVITRAIAEDLTVATGTTCLFDDPELGADVTISLEGSGRLLF